MQPLPRAATLPPPARPAKARGTPSGVHRSLPGVSVKTEIICAVVCMWHGGEQSSPNVRVAAPQRGLCRVRLTSVRPPFPFSPSFLPGAGILDGVHCVLNLALKSLDQNFLTLTGRLGRPESGRGESPHAPMSIWKPQRLPGRTGCAGDSLQTLVSPLLPRGLYCPQVWAQRFARGHVHPLLPSGSEAVSSCLK